MNITMIGAGYVGLVSAACFAKWGHRVHCIDIDSQRITRLRSGEMPLYEPGLGSLFQQGIASERLTFSDKYDALISESQIVMIAVGTPAETDSTARPDLSAVLASGRSVAEFLREGAVVVLKSTVPVGTAEKVTQAIARIRPSGSFSVAANPEFLREGRAIDDFLHPDRVVIGTDDENSRNVLRSLYTPLIQEDVPILFTQVCNAELIKYVANAYLATRVAFINEIADLCETLELNVNEIAQGVGLDRRIGREFLHAGPGFGGSCLPKDVCGLLFMAREHRARLGILERVNESNQQRKTGLWDRIQQVLGPPAGKTVTLLGLAFKAGTDDIRYAPALDLIPVLLRAGAQVRAYDPQASETMREQFPEAEYLPDVESASEGADLLVLHTEWPEFLNLDWQRLYELVRTPQFYDLRNCCDLEKISAAGFDCFAIGRPPLQVSASARENQNTQKKI